MAPVYLQLLLPYLVAAVTNNAANDVANWKSREMESSDVKSGLVKSPSHGQVHILRSGTTTNDGDNDGDISGLGRMLENKDDNYLVDGVNETSHDGTKEMYYVDWAQRGEINAERDGRGRNNKRNNRQNNRQNNNRPNGRPNSRTNNKNNGRNNRTSNGRRSASSGQNSRRNKPNNQTNNGRGRNGPKRGTRNQSPNDETSSSQIIIAPKPSTDPSTSSPSNSPSTKGPTIESTKNVTKQPTDDPTLAPTTKPSADPTKQPTAKPTADPTYPPTRLPTGSPSPLPSRSPSESPTATQPTPNPTHNLTGSPTTGDTSNGTDLVLPPDLAYPHVRYTKWTELQPGEKAVATETLGYVRNSWNHLYINEIEASLFRDLNEDMQQGVMSLGMDAEEWNCYINHYTGYYWSELQDVGIAPHYETLGWTKAMWDGGDGVPDSEDLYWEDLSAAQKEAALNICFVENSWNAVAINDW